MCNSLNKHSLLGRQNRYAVSQLAAASVMRTRPSPNANTLQGRIRNKMVNKKSIPAIICMLAATGCATIVNDANIPLAFNFSDGSTGECTFKNKRGVWTSSIPTSSAMIRRSDDALIYECKTDDGREATGSVRSEVEGEKMAASVIFWDLGITDAITDKHRTYQGNVVIAVPQKQED